MKRRRRTLTAFADRVERELFDRSVWTLGGFLLAFSVLTNGIWHTPNISYFVLMAQTFPETPLFEPRATYLFSSSLGPAVASILGLEDVLGIVLLHLAVVLASMVGLIVVVVRQFGDVAARLLMVALFCLPLPNLLFTWLGQPDAFTFGSASALVVLASPTLHFTAAAVLGVNQFEQGVFIVLAVVALRLVKNENSFRTVVSTLAPMLAGLLLGKLILHLYFYAYDVVRESRLEVLLATGIGHLVSVFLAKVPIFSFSVFNAFWIFLGSAFLRHRRCLVIPLVLLGILVLPSSLALDQTRIYALVSWPVVLWTVLWMSQHEDPGVLRRLTVVTFLAGLVLPRVIVWSLGNYTSSIGRLLRWLLP